MSFGYLHRLLKGCYAENLDVGLDPTVARWPLTAIARIALGPGFCMLLGSRRWSAPPTRTEAIVKPKSWSYRAPRIGTLAVFVWGLSACGSGSGGSGAGGSGGSGADTGGSGGAPTGGGTGAGGIGASRAEPGADFHRAGRQHRESAGREATGGSNATGGSGATGGAGGGLGYGGSRSAGFSGAAGSGGVGGRHAGGAGGGGLGGGAGGATAHRGDVRRRPSHRDWRQRDHVAGRRLDDHVAQRRCDGGAGRRPFRDQRRSSRSARADGGAGHRHAARGDFAVLDREPDIVPVSVGAGMDLVVTVQMVTTASNLPAAPADKNVGSTFLSATLTATVGATPTTAAVYGLLLIQDNYEPTLGQILVALGYKLNVGKAQNNWNPNTSMMAVDFPGVEAGTDEVAAPLFVKAGTGLVTLTIAARFSPVGALPYGWYPSASVATLNTVGTLSMMTDAQTSNKARMVYPPLQAGSATTFDPGSASFGLWIYSDQKTEKYNEGGNVINGDYDYTQDGPNAPVGVHRVKSYPLKNSTGTAVPHEFLVADRGGRQWGLSGLRLRPRQRRRRAVGAASCDRAMPHPTKEDEMRVSLRAILLPFVVAFALPFGSGVVRAAGNPASCDNDIDCVATPECGGDVCTYSATGSPACTPAGTGASGQDGWCTSDTDCKCYAQGALCKGVYCTFTKPPPSLSDGGAGAAGRGGAGGAVGHAGEGDGQPGEGGSSANGGGGCSTSGGLHPGGWSAIVLLGLSATFWRGRRRRR